MLSERLRAHVRILSEAIGERNSGHADGLKAAAEYIKMQFKSAGKGDLSTHAFATTTLSGGTSDGVNIVLEFPSERNDNSAESNQIFVIGAHYDTVAGSPGANDNASGIAALIEMAFILAKAPLKTTIRLVAFANEEHQNMAATMMGSYAYAKDCASRDENMAGMWSLETLGFYSNEPDSQKYPPPFNSLYPDTGNFVAFVGNYASRHWIRESISAFRETPGFPSEGLAAPAKLADINRSDNWGFWQFGFPALMITDTANFRYRWYHSPEDTAEKVNYTALAKVVRRLSLGATKLAGA